MGEARGCVILVGQPADVRVSKSELSVALSRSATPQNPDASTPFGFRGVLAPEIRGVPFHFAVLARLQASQGKAFCRSCTWNNRRLVLFAFQCASFLGTCDWHDEKRKNYCRVLCNRLHRPDGGLRGASLRALRRQRRPTGEIEQRQPLENLRVGPGRFLINTDRPWRSPRDSPVFSLAQ